MTPRSPRHQAMILTSRTTVYDQTYDQTTYHPYSKASDRYEPPPGAVRLAYSEACNEQAFQYGDRVLGLQFHLEATPAWVDTLARRDQDQLLDAAYIQTRQQMLSPVENFARANEFMNQILDRLVDAAIGTTHDRGQGNRSWI